MSAPLPAYILLAMLCGALGAAAVAIWGRRLGLVDVPNHRSSHTRTTPKGGGLGILVAFSLASLTAPLAPPVFTLSACTLALLGLLGDRHELSPRLRLAIQLLCGLAAVSLWQGSSLLLFPWLLFLVGTANFYNFMDGINGIAGITGTIAFSALALLFHATQNDPAMVAVSASLGAACLGFLPFNLPHARVFMGDVGSILLGFCFAFLVMRLSTTWLDFLCSASLLFPFYIDELSTMAIRLRRGEPLTQAHRRHLYQIMANEKAMPHWQVSLLYGLMQIGVAGGVFALRPFGASAVLALLFLASGLFLLLSQMMRRRLAGR